MIIIDSHCHLTYEPMANSLKETVERANNDGVKYMLTISTEHKSFNKIVKIVSEYKSVYGTYGIHPHEAKSHRYIKCDDILKNVNINSKIIGIGETGLDFYYNHSNKKDQTTCFEEHILASQKQNLPLIIHTRSAEKETFELLYKHNKKKRLKMLIHCFTGTRDFAFKLLDMGAYISASGVVTFKNSSDLANTFKDIPNERILVETDSPYLAPVPLRGKSNEPRNIIHTVRFLSKLKNISFNNFSKITTENFFNLFGKLD